jgi:phosphoribosylaminoimidazole carboxylase PurE protein
MSSSLVAIMMGSPRDWPAMKPCAETLRSLNVPFEVLVTSAHKTPERTREYLDSLMRRGVEVAICGAGAAAHLAGVVAAEFPGPVIAVPIAATELAGVDALLAMVQMPSGVPVATVAIGEPGARNSAVLAAQILAKGYPEIADGLVSHRNRMKAAYGENVGATSAPSPTTDDGPLVAVVCGSESDRKTMERTIKILDELEISNELFITGDVRTPERTRRYAQALEGRGVQAVVVGAGASAALAGTVAAYYAGPVIAVPLASTALAGWDALLSTVQMPSGVPVGAVAVGAMGAKNAALLAGQILGVHDQSTQKRVLAHRNSISATLIQEANDLLATLPEENRGHLD